MYDGLLPSRTLAALSSPGLTGIHENETWGRAHTFAQAITRVLHALSNVMYELAAPLSIP
jgi:hypothetical protein